ncbi:MAG: hypothetical protein AB1540_02505 [Bdellovibrionota bacterium]
MERIVCAFLRESSSIEPFAESCFRFTPQIAVRDNEAIFLEIGRSLGLFEEKTLLVRLSVLAQRFGYLPHLGVAEDAPTAFALAKFGCKKRSQLPLEALFAYASPFAHDEIIHVKAIHMMQALRSLGVKDLQGFLKIPVSALASRFGAEGVELGMRVSQSFAGKLSLSWPKFRPAEKIFEEIELNEFSVWPACADLEPLLFVLRGLLDRIVARLRGRGLRAASLGVNFEFEKNESERRRDWKIEFALPQGSVSSMIPILRDKLSFDAGKRPFPALVNKINLEVLETAPGHGAQKNLFSAEEEEKEAWNALIARLAQKLGKEGAFLAQPVDRHLPEKAWSRVLEIKEKLMPKEEYPMRPARVLKKPVLLRKEGESLVGVKQSWHVKEWIGPERLSIEWWRDPDFRGFNRDYYRVLTDSGQQLWVFSTPGKKELFLHGYFD